MPVGIIAQREILQLQCSNIHYTGVQGPAEQVTTEGGVGMQSSLLSRWMTCSSITLVIVLEANVSVLLL